MSLTEDLRVISAERADYNTLPGHDVVVFELKDGGYRNMTVVAEGEAFTPRRSLGFVKADYVSYAVNRNPALFHRFTRRYQHMTASHPFDLTFVVTFKVASPEILVRRRVDDPVQRLCDEVARTFSSELCKEPWPDIIAGKRRDNLSAIWNRLWTGSKTGLTDFAALYGLGLESVSGALDLNEADDEPSRKVEELARKLDMARTQQQLDGLERNQRKQSEIEETRARAEVESFQHQLHRQQGMHKIEIATLEVKEALVRGTGENILKGMSSATAHIDTFEALERGMKVGTRMVQPLLAGGNTAAPGFSMDSGESLGMLAGPNAPEIVKLVSEILGQYGEIADQPGRPRRFLAAALHWVAELSLGNQANAALLQEYARILRDPPDDLSGAQTAFLQKLLDKEQIEAMLS